MSCGQFPIGMSIAQGLLGLQAPQENSRVLSRSFRIRHQNGGRGRSQNLHVDPRHHNPRLHGRRHTGLGGVVRDHHQRRYRPANHRRDPFSRRVLHADPVGLRSAHRRVRADASGLARQAPGRDDCGYSEKLGPGLCRQLRRRADNRIPDGIRDDVRIYTGARQGRHCDRKHRRSPDAGLCGAWRGRHG